MLKKLILLMLVVVNFNLNSAHDSSDRFRSVSKSGFDLLKLCRHELIHPLPVLLLQGQIIRNGYTVFAYDTFVSTPSACADLKRTFPTAFYVAGLDVKKLISHGSQI